MTVLIALGGNAMTAPDGSARPQDQRAAIGVAAESVADIVAADTPVVLTHGNGPQVGNLLVKNEIAAAVVPPVPLDWCGAQTQGTIGVLLLNALDAALDRRDISTRTAVVVSRTLVDPDDRGFADPTKPIGRYLPAAEAADLIAHGQTWRDFGPAGWRRVVASPEPLACLDAAAAAALLAAGFVVVCAGGGGVPVVRDSRGGLRGVEAVIDKDLTAAVLGRQLGADYADHRHRRRSRDRRLGHRRRPPDRGDPSCPDARTRQRRALPGGQHGTKGRGCLPVRRAWRPGDHHVAAPHCRCPGRAGRHCRYPVSPSQSAEEVGPCPSRSRYARCPCITCPTPASWPS